MIEIEGHKYIRAYLQIYISIVAILYVLFFYGVFISNSPITLETFMFFLFILIVLASVSGIFYHLYSSGIVRVEAEGDQYRLTRLDKKQITITSNQVIRILHSERRYVLVLNDGRRLNLEKVYRFRLAMSYDVFDPWLPFLTKERFPNAEFGSLPIL